ncbi:unnamed protein product, partial [marine sediment metagenome]
PNVAINNDSEAICVFSGEIDNDQEIFYTLFQSETPGDIIQFTFDCDFNDTSPSVVYENDGTPYIVWLKHKYLTKNNETLYDGNLYYRRVGSTQVEAVRITNGSVYDPLAFQSQSTTSLRDGDADFAVGWKSGKMSNELRYAQIKTNVRNDDGYDGDLIYSSDKKLSEVFWCFSPEGIAIATTERETIRTGGKNCDLSFIYKSTLDNSPPYIPT